MPFAVGTVGMEELLLRLAVGLLVAGPVSFALARFARSESERRIGTVTGFALGVVVVVFLGRYPWILDEVIERFAFRGLAIAFAALFAIMILWKVKSWFWR